MKTTQHTAEQIIKIVNQVYRDSFAHLPGKTGL